MTRTLLAAAGGLFALAAPVACCFGQVTLGVQQVRVDLARTWYDGSGTQVAGDTALTGPTVYRLSPVNTQTTRIDLLPTSLPGPNGTALNASGYGYAQIAGSVNVNGFRFASTGVVSETGLVPPFGHALLTGAVTHTVSFQLDAPLTWVGSVDSTLSAADVRVNVILNPDFGLPTTVYTRTFAANLPATNFSGTLAPGSYVIEVVHSRSTDISSNFPSGSIYGGTFARTVQIAIPGPSAAAAFVFGCGLLASPRRRR